MCSDSHTVNSNTINTATVLHYIKHCMTHKNVKKSISAKVLLEIKHQTVSPAGMSLYLSIDCTVYNTVYWMKRYVHYHDS